MSKVFPRIGRRHALQGSAAGFVAFGLLLWWLLPLGEKPPTGTITFSTGTLRGVYQEYGERLRTELGRDMPGLKVKLVQSAGSYENVRRVATGQADFTIAAADAVETYELNDGRGADRILDAMGFDPTVRPATDAALLLSWRNDPETRRWSRTPDPVPVADHQSWLSRTLASPDRRLFVAEHEGRPVGTVRFDRAGEAWEVNITVAPSARGRRLAAPMLLAAERALGPAVIRANVHHANTASLAVFRRVGYRLTTDGEWQWLTKSPSQE